MTPAPNSTARTDRASRPVASGGDGSAHSIDCSTEAVRARYEAVMAEMRAQVDREPSLADATTCECGIRLDKHPPLPQPEPLASGHAQTATERMVALGLAVKPEGSVGHRPGKDHAWNYQHQRGRRDA